jgi:hypothetical protein
MARTSPDRLSVVVLDERSRRPLHPRHASASVAGPALWCETEISGRCELPHIPEGPCQIRVEKEGYYSAASSVEPAGSSEIEITLNHLKEIKETVDVHESPPMIENAVNVRSAVLPKGASGWQRPQAEIRSLLICAIDRFGSGCRTWPQGSKTHHSDKSYTLEPSNRKTGLGLPQI